MTVWHIEALEKPFRPSASISGLPRSTDVIRPARLVPMVSQNLFVFDDYRSCRYRTPTVPSVNTKAMNAKTNTSCVETIGANLSSLTGGGDIRTTRIGRAKSGDCDGPISTQRSAHDMPMTTSSLCRSVSNDLAVLSNCPGSSSGNIADIASCHLGSLCRRPSRIGGR